MFSAALCHKMQGTWIYFEILLTGIEKFLLAELKDPCSVSSLKNPIMAILAIANILPVLIANFSVLSFIQFNHCRDLDRWQCHTRIICLSRSTVFLRPGCATGKKLLPILFSGSVHKENYIARKDAGWDSWGRSALIEIRRFPLIWVGCVYLEGPEKWPLPCLLSVVSSKSYTTITPWWNAK